MSDLEISAAVKADIDAAFALQKQPVKNCP